MILVRYQIFLFSLNYTLIAILRMSTLNLSSIVWSVFFATLSYFIWTILSIAVFFTQQTHLMGQIRKFTHTHTHTHTLTHSVRLCRWMRERDDCMMCISYSQLLCMLIQQTQYVTLDRMSEWEREPQRISKVQFCFCFETVKKQVVYTFFRSPTH